MKNKVVIIAEAGVNHNGSFNNALKLVDAAVFAGADFIKFQTFRTELNISRTASRAAYQINNTKSDESQFDMVKKLELSFEQFLEIKKYCDKKNIGFVSTGFDIPSLDFLETLNPTFYKIPSGEITNKPYLQHIAKIKKAIVLSTGMADMQEIKVALNILIEAGLDKSKLTVLHCNTEYPTPMSDVNLKAMLHIKEELDVGIGYSDHTLGIEVPIAAVALGATVIEKHFTLDRNLPGPDHKASLEPGELKQMVQSIRNIEIAIGGSGRKEPSESEIPNKAIARKSIHLLKSLKAGHNLQESDLIMRRPGDGISPMEIDQVVGKKLKCDLQEDVKLSQDHLE
ncbi:N-acetylneuraminate synthase [Marivirga salinae]|uniref:N-acetylneuraminate synthase n=1 Tax=Marivirga salinarum TaxID=3059078 RepID=A0AA51N999_9BACT|nr:N-acetylneuraminate synthase [Marivirga sp. BDSF4-3]WMN10913.1 N-acetylneuraminate synthase [Marivirga sp. BDSF4-3]